jgi:hypothetical protein
MLEMLRSFASRLRARSRRGDHAVTPVNSPRPRRPLLVTAGVVVFAGLLGILGGLELRRHLASPTGSTGTFEQRQALFDLLQPVALGNCRLERFGEPHDGGYLMCGNLLEEVQAGYSYGIAGYDQWGCDISTRRDVTVHQYDCFDTRQPACPGGRMTFHAECVGNASRTEDGRPFDTIENQFSKNGDRAKRIALKIDVEGAEWDSLLTAPDDVLQQIDQMAIEFHWVEDEKSLALVRRLKQFFEVAHIHFNNASCISGMEPFPAWAYEVLFVSKRLAVVDPADKAGGAHPLDAPNIALISDCQP